MSDDSPYIAMRNQEKFDKKPHCIYFYYCGPLIDGEREIKHYYYSDDGPIRRDELKGLARTLGRNARKAIGTPPADGYGFEYVVWKRKSYVMFLIDDPLTKIVEDDGLTIKWQKTENELEDNHSFFDAKDFTVNLAEPGQPAEKRSVVVVQNHLKKNRNGDDADAVPQLFKLTLNLNPPESARGALKDRLPDSGGTNQGPGVPPPG